MKNKKGELKAPEDDFMIFPISRGKRLGLKDVSLKRNTHLGRRLRMVCRPLEITPVYLIFPADREEVLDSEKLILEHIERTYS